MTSDETGICSKLDVSFHSYKYQKDDKYILFYNNEPKTISVELLLIIR
jgi:hypothetical protein